MPIGNPNYQYNQWLRAFVTKPEFQSLSPESQKAFQTAALAAEGGAPPPRDQAFLGAIQEASQKGLTPHMTAKDWLAVAAIVGGGVAAPFIVSALGGGAAASYIGADVASTAAASGGATAAGAAAGEAAYIGADVASTASAASGAETAGSILSQAAPYIKKAAPILGGMAKAGAEANANRDRILPSMEGAQLSRDKFALEAPTTRMDQSMRASAIKNAAPVAVNWGGPGSGLRGQVPSFTGGYQGALANLDPQTRQLAETILQKDLQDQLAGTDDDTKWLDQFGKTSTKDKIVGGLATGANIYSGITG
jgi:hypothetical protein